MRRLLLLTALALVVAGCAGDPVPAGRQAAVVTPAPFGDTRIVAGLRYESPAGPTLLENVRTDDGLAALGVLVLGRAAGVGEPAPVVRTVVADALAGAAHPAAGHGSWAGAYVLAAAASRWPDSLPRARVVRAVSALPRPQGDDRLWAALTRAEGFPVPVGSAQGCTAAATAARHGSETEFAAAIDTFAAAQPLSSCDALSDVVRARITSMPPTLPMTARACLVPDCAGQTASVGRLVSDRIAGLAAGDLQQWGDVSAAEYAVLGVLGDLTRVTQHPAAALRARVDALVRVGGLPTSSDDPSDLGLLFSTILAREAGRPLGAVSTSTHRSATAGYAQQLRSGEGARATAGSAPSRSWTPEDWFVAGLENLRSGACPAGLASASRGVLDRFALRPRSGTMQMAALAYRMLRACHVAVDASLSAAVGRVAHEVLAATARTHDVPLQVAWSARNALCFTGRAVPDVGLHDAARRYLVRLAVAGLTSWNLGEYFAARSLAAGDGCTVTWFGR